MKIAKTKRDYNFKKILLMRDRLKLEIPDDFSNFENVDEENSINDYRNLRDLVHHFFKNEITPLPDETITENYEETMTSIDYDLIKKEIENNLSKSLIYFKNKLQMVDEKK